MSMRSLLLSVWVLLLSACAGYKLNANHDPQASFIGLNTYAWIPEPQNYSGDKTLIKDSVVDARIRNYVDKEFSDRGYVKTDKESARFLVGYHLLTEKKVSLQVLNTYYNYRKGGWGWHYYPYEKESRESRTFEYQPATLIIDIASPEQQLIWRGHVYDPVNLSGREKARQAVFQNAVKQLLNTYPPKR